MTGQEAAVGQKKSRFIVGITFTVTSCILAIVIVGVGVVSFQQWRSAKQAADAAMAHNADLVVSQVERLVAQFLSPAEAFVQGMAAKTAAADWVDRGHMVPADVLTAALAAVPRVESAGMLYDDGTDVFAERTADGLNVRTADRREDPSFEALREFRATATAPSWSDPTYDSASKAPVLTVWRAVRKDGRYYGAWHADVTAADLSEQILQIGEGVGGTAFIIAGDDGMLAHPNLMSSHPDPEAGHPLAGVARIGDLVLEAFWDAGKDIRTADDRAARLSTVSFEVAGERYTGYLRRITRYGQQPWTVGVWFQSRDLEIFNKALRNGAIYAVLTILLTVLVAVAAGRVISRPIVNAARAVETVGRGDLESSVDLPPSRITELNELATAFNTMRHGMALFETYVPRSLVRKLMEMDSDEIQSVERDLTIMFTDIVGFTSISEGKSPAEVAKLVNEHFDLLGACVDKFGGTIDKYMGDGMMAFWGAPEEIDDQQVRACYCAMEMVDALERYNLGRRKEGLPLVRVRIGIHSGPALVGNIGAEGRMNYTVIGDTVNTCQRIENLGREVAQSKIATIVVSDAVARHLPASMPYVEVGQFQVKGREQPVVAYRLMT